MGEAIGRMLASAVGIAVSPVAVAAVVLLLSSATPRARVNAAAFTAGWLAALAALAAAVAALGAVLSAGRPYPAWSWWARLAGGVLLLVLAVRRWRDRPGVGHVHAPPAWMRRTARFTPGRSAGLAARLALGDPKNLLLATGAALSVGAGAGTGGDKAAALVLLVLLGSLCVLLPLGADLLGTYLTGLRPVAALSRWRAWAAAHGAAVAMVVPLLLGASYLGEAVSGLTV